MWLKLEGQKSVIEEKEKRRWGARGYIYISVGKSWYQLKYRSLFVSSGGTRCVEHTVV
jgi:hypothetical protein